MLLFGFLPLVKQVAGPLDQLPFPGTDPGGMNFKSDGKLGDARHISRGG
jgi:hypothetical protein